MKDDRKINKTAVAGVAGAAIGVGIAVAAGKMLSDEKTKKNIKKAFAQTRRTVMQSVENMKEKANELMIKNEKKVEQVKSKAKKTIVKAKQNTEKIKKASKPEPARA